MSHTPSVVTPAAESYADPITPAEFSAWVAPWLSPGVTRVAFGISGGPDSMALAFCLRRWAEEHSIALQALIVDHRLRPESSVEAAATQTRLAALGVPAEILAWEHGTVASDLQRQARQARYELLFAACARLEIHDLFLAHQADDQAETLLMRFAKGSGLDGLAGMSPVTSLGQFRLLRPFLGVRKARLLATCHAAELPYILDPSNLATRFARGRLRRVMPLLEAEGFSVERLLDLAARAREAQEALEHYTLEFLRHAASFEAAGVIRLDRAKLRAAPQAVALRVLDRALQTINPGDPATASGFGPERAPLLALLREVWAEDALTVRTLHGCLIQLNGGDVVILREFAAIHAFAQLVPGVPLLWDGRWEIALAQGCDETGLSVRALGVQPHETLDHFAPGLRHAVPQGRVRAALPALWHGARLAAIPAPVGVSVLAKYDKGLAEVRHKRPSWE